MKGNKFVAILIIALMVCSVLTMQAGITPAQAASVNLADQAIGYLSNQYLADGTGSSGLGSYDAYILQSAGVNVSDWVYNGESLATAVSDLASQDISNGATVAVKTLAEDLVAMRKLGNTSLASQLRALLTSRQNTDGSFQNDNATYSIIPAYDLLGRAGELSVINVVYAENYITQQQVSVSGATYGAWGYSYDGVFYPDFMITAEAVRALNYLDPGASSGSLVGQAISNGCSWLNQQQQSDGSFNPPGSYDDSLIDTVEAINTQKALGLDPTSAWTDGGRSAVSYLESVTPNTNGSFGSYGNLMDATWLLDGCTQLGISPDTDIPLEPAIIPDGGSITTTNSVGINADLTSANQTLYYTITSGSAGMMPTVASTVYSAPFTVSSSAGTYTVEAAVYDSGLGLWSIPATAAFTVSSGGAGGGTTSTSVSVAIVGQSGQSLYGPAYVNVNQSNQWGLTVLGALAATGIQYTTTNTSYGVWVTGIDGESMQQGGTAGWMFTLNGVAPSQGPAATSISNGDHVIWYWSGSMNQGTPTSTGNSAGVTSTTGSATVDPSAGGTISLGSSASVDIPAGALNGTASTMVTVQQANNAPPAPAGFSLLGSVYEFTVGGQTSYQFAKDITLTFTFNPSSLAAGETPAIYYYDVSSGKWVNLGGTVSGNTITVNVDHFTEYAVMAVPAAQKNVSVTFSDVPTSFWAYNAIESVSSLGCIKGYPDGSFKPDATITRAEFISILARALKLSAYNPATPSFSDVNHQSWYYGAVESAVYAGIVKGYDNSFEPNAPITREQMAVILVNALGEHAQAETNMGARTSFTDNAGISPWARGFVVLAARDGLVKGYPDGSFEPQGSATRAEACAMMMNFLHMHK